MKKQIMCFLFVILCGVIFPQEQEQPRLAIVKFTANEAVRTQEVASTVRNLVESKMVASGEYEIMTREEIDLLLENQQIQLNLISGDENLKKLQLQNINYLVTGTIDLIDDTCIVTIKLLDVKTGKFTNSVSEIMKNDAYALFEGTAALATNLMAGLIVAGGSIEAVNRTGAYKIGDIGPGGGLVFFVEGNTYLECSEYLGKAKWKKAVSLIKNYRGGGYDDWYLPTIEELNSIYVNLRVTNLILNNDMYWSSSVTNFTYAWCQRFRDGFEESKYKSSNNGVRAVRAFISEPIETPEAAETSVTPETPVTP